MKENVIQEKSFRFAVRIIKLYKYLCEEKKEFVLSKQILRSGTSIGANVEEAIAGQTDKDFIAKISIAQKEARETRYWLKLMIETDFLTAELCETLLQDIEEINKIIAKILLTMKSKPKQNL
jgi:four helix bundle protein